MSYRDIRVSVLTAALLLAVVVGLGTASVAAQDADDTNTTVNETEPRGLALGHEISIVMRSQRQHVEREVERESFRLAFGNASEANRSQVAEREVERIHNAVAEAHRERERLIQELQDGNITPREFSTRMAEINIRVSETARSLNRARHLSNRSNVSLNHTRLNRTRRLTRGVLGNATGALNRTPPGYGVLETARRAHRLARNASNMTGQEISERARNLGRERVRTPANGSPPGQGPPDGDVGGNTSSPGGQGQGQNNGTSPGGNGMGGGRR